MKTLLTVIVLATSLIGCESLYEDDGIPRIRSQRQVDAYNATVSSEGEKLVCERERPLGSTIPRLVCMTVDLRERIRLQSRENIELLGRGQAPTN